MNKPLWPTVPMSELLRQRKGFITIDDIEVYKRPRVKLHAQGIVLRDEVPGAMITTKSQQLCRGGDLLVAEIDAKVGGYGIVPPSLEGAIVSSHYFLFEIDEHQLDRDFLGYFIQTPFFHRQVEAQGSTNYAAIRPSHVLGYHMPLPQLSSQKEIVAMIRGVENRTCEAVHLRRETQNELTALYRSILKSDLNSQLVPMNMLVRLRQTDVIVRGDETYQFAGVYSFGRGVFKGQAKTGMEFAYSRLTRLRQGDFVYPKLMAWEGALGIVPPECDGLVVSPEFPVFEVMEDRILPEVLDVYFRTPSVWPKISGSSTGTNVRRRRLNPADFLRYEIPVPSRAAQLRLRCIMSETAPLKALQSQTDIELAAMLPSLLSNVFSGAL